MVAVVNYGIGNIRSVVNALNYLGADCCLTNDPKMIRDSDRVIFPGQGAFKECITSLKSSGLFEILNEEVIGNRKPFMGICLGMQILAEYSQEDGLHRGFGWINGEVVRLGSDKNLRLQHVGWNTIDLLKDCPLFKGVSSGTDFYFVHTYHLVCRDKDCVLATSEYGIQFNVAVLKDNIFATQFHPERSQENSLKILSNFINWRP